MPLSNTTILSLHMVSCLAAQIGTLNFEHLQGDLEDGAGDDSVRFSLNSVFEHKTAG